MKVAVVGSGLVGLNCAHALLDEGHAVTLVDRGGRDGRPSNGNAGFIAHTDILPLASPKAWRQIPGWLRDPLGPLSVRPAYGLRLAPWLLRFALESRPARIEAATLAMRSINGHALAAWKARLRRLGLERHLQERGYLYVWDEDEGFRAMQAAYQRQRAFGIRVELLESEDLRRLEPAFGPRVRHAAYFPDGANVSDSRVLTEALHEQAVARGVEVVEADADAITTDAEKLSVRAGARRIAADRVVVAAGAWSKPLAAALGDKVPLDTERGYNTSYPPGTFGLTRPVLYEGKGFVTTPLETGDRIGGAVEFAGLDAPPDHRRSRALVRKLVEFLPHLDGSLPAGREWMGFRPSLPDSLSVIGPASREARVIYAFGHGHYGLTQSAVTGDMVAALVAGRRPEVDPTPFGATRFRRW